MNGLVHGYVASKDDEVLNGSDRKRDTYTYQRVLIEKVSNKSRAPREMTPTFENNSCTTVSESSQ
jgi:hypothetical protein